MGVVYYANYLVWMEVGRVELCRACGFHYRDMERDDGVLLAVAEANCRYLSPARFDDEVIDPHLDRARQPSHGDLRVRDAWWASARWPQDSPGIYFWRGTSVPRGCPRKYLRLFGIEKKGG